MTYQQTKKIRALMNQSQDSGGLISMYIPIAYPDGDPELTYQRLWKEAMKLRSAEHQSELIAPQIPWALLLRQQKNAVAIFISPSGHVIYPLDESVPVRLVVATSFHLKPLVASYSKNYSRKLLDKVLEKGEYYQHGGLDDFHQLKQKIISGNYKTLVISLEDMLFHEGSNYRKLSRTQRNDKDDDALDDLLELAIRERIKVGVVSRDFLPEKSFLVAC